MSRGVCVVTGGSRGIGAAAAKRVAREGWDVAVNYRSEADAANAVVAAVRSLGRRAEAIQADVAVESEIDALFAAADRLGPITALVNNAGIVAPADDITTFDFARVQRVVALNVTGAIWCARAAVMRMATRFGGRGGAIVNLSSAAARLGAPGTFVDYAATKGAMDSFTVGLAKEWAGDAIRVNAVRPGIIDTEIHASGGIAERLVTEAPKQPMGRAGTAEEVAEAIVWLLSDAASYTTGGFIDVSGGRIAQP